MIGHFLYTTLSFVHNSVAIGESKLELQSGNTQLGWKSAIFVACDLEIRRMTLKNNRASLLCYFKLCASFHIHQWIQTGVTVRKHPIRVKIGDFWGTRIRVGVTKALFINFSVENISHFAKVSLRQIMVKSMNVTSNSSWPGVTYMPREKQLPIP